MSVNILAIIFSIVTFVLAILVAIFENVKNTKLRKIEDFLLLPLIIIGAITVILLYCITHHIVF